MIPEGKGVKTEEELAKFRAEKRKNRKENHLKAFHLNITPEQYRGMIFLGNFKSQDQSNTLKDPRVAHLHHELFLNKAVLDLGAGDGAVAIEVAMRMLPRKIVALEIDAELIAIAKRRVDKIILNSEKYRAVREDLELQKTLSEFPLFFQ
jgi:spermidine synthase